MNKIPTGESGRGLVGEWIGSLAGIIEAMSGQRPRIEWKIVSALADAGFTRPSELLCWEGQFQFAEDARVCVAAPQPTWEHTGNLILKAAGVETASPDELRSTWLEIVGQWLGSLASALTSHCGHEIALGKVGEIDLSSHESEWLLITLQPDESTFLQFAASFNSPMRSLFEGDSTPREFAGHLDAPAASAAPAPSRTMSLLLDVDLPVSISFGKTHLPLKDVLKLTTGSIVELNRGVNEPVEVLVNNFLVARGEVVVVDGNYGIRIQQIASREDRLHSLR
jgi:flagellar motor switch protein FliN/FliY